MYFFKTKQNHLQRIFPLLFYNSDTLPIHFLYLWTNRQLSNSTIPAYFKIWRLFLEFKLVFHLTVHFISRTIRFISLCSFTLIFFLLWALPLQRCVRGLTLTRYTEVRAAFASSGSEIRDRGGWGRCCAGCGVLPYTFLSTRSLKSN